MHMQPSGRHEATMGRIHGPDQTAGWLGLAVTNQESAGAARSAP